MKSLMLFLLQFGFIFQAFSQTYRWPCDYTSNPKIGFNHGVNEEAGVAFDFHLGIDIKYLSVQEIIFAVDDGDIYLV